MNAAAGAVLDAELVWRLFVLLKAAGVYSRENAGYREHAAPALAALRAVLEADGQARLEAVHEGLLLNGRRLPREPGVRTAAGYVAGQMERHGVGLIRVERGAGAGELDALAYAFARAGREAPLDELSRALLAEGAGQVGLAPPEAAGAAAAAGSAGASGSAGPLGPGRAARARRSFFSAVEAVEGVMAGLREGARPSLDAAQEAVSELSRRVLEDEQELFELTLLREFDEYTYAHSVNVCVYGAAIGARLGLRDEALEELGQACLFHDVGKARLPRALLDKPGELDAAEWVLMRRHPILGARVLLGLRPRPGRALTRAAVAAFEHHRGADGQGYPALPRRPRQDVFSRICALADAFDALTSGRVYAKRALTPHEAVLRMAQRAHSAFDPLLFRVFVNAVGIYPIGTLLELDTGERALVRRNGADLLRPSLLRLDDGSAEELGARGVRRALSAREEGVDAAARLEAFSGPPDVLGSGTRAPAPR